MEPFSYIWKQTEINAREIINGFTVPKFIYTFILCCLVALIVSEIRRIWFHRNLQIRSFKFFSDGKEATASGDDFALRVLDRHRQLGEHIRQVKPSEFASENDLLPKGASPLELSQSELAELKIQFQQINITDILAQISRLVSTPREVNGTVSKTGTTFRTFFNIGRQRVTLANGDPLDPAFHSIGLESEDDAAFETACTMVWLENARVNDKIAAVPREEFCQWARRWVKFLDIHSRRARRGRMIDADTTSLEELLKELTAIIDKGVVYARFYQLRADIVDALPEEKRTPALRVQAQSDRLRYEVLLEVISKNALADPLDDPAAFERLAKARPAIPVHDGKLDETVAKEWQRVLQPSADSVKGAALATGLLRIHSPSVKAGVPSIGFAVGPNLILAGYVPLPGELRQTDGATLVTLNEEFRGEFTFADRWPASVEEAKIHPVKRILSFDAGNMLLLEIEGHDVNQHKPLKFSANQDLKREEFVAIIGNPRQDRKLPASFVKNLLGDQLGIKRVLPGRIIDVPRSANASTAPLTAGSAEIRVDCSPIEGIIGGPLVHLASGEVIGISTSGQWEKISDPKFGYALPVNRFFSQPIVAATLRSLGVERPALEQVVAALPAEFVTRPPLVASVAAVTTSMGNENLGDFQAYDAHFLSGEPLELPTLGADLKADAFDGGKPLTYPHFSIIFNQKRRFAFVGAWNVDLAQQILVPRRAPDDWVLDPRVPADTQPDNKLFIGNNLDRGNIVRRADVAWGSTEIAAEAAQATFHYTNAVPQHSLLNQRSWMQMENHLINQASLAAGEKMSIFSGPVLSPTDPQYRDYQIPEKFWKIAVIDQGQGKYQVLSYMLSQDFGGKLDDNADATVDRFDPLTSQVPIEEIERLTKLDFASIKKHVRKP